MRYSKDLLMVAQDLLVVDINVLMTMLAVVLVPFVYEIVLEINIGFVLVNPHCRFIS